ncbi:hypothetical protein OKW42_007196 [Paraburkholderia sp. WC7.3d]
MPPKISPKKRATMVRLPGRILISAGEPYRAPLGATLPAKYPHQNPTAAGPPRSPADDFAIEDLNPRYTTHAIPRAQRQGDETPGPVIPTRSSIRRLNPRRDGFLARLFSADTASDTEISSQHLTAFIGPRWQINAARFTKTSRSVVSKCPAERCRQVILFSKRSAEPRRSFKDRTALPVSKSTLTAAPTTVKHLTLGRNRGIPIYQGLALLSSHRNQRCRNDGFRDTTGIRRTTPNAPNSARAVIRVSASVRQLPAAFPTFADGRSRMTGLASAECVLSTRCGLTCLL